MMTNLCFVVLWTAVTAFTLLTQVSPASLDVNTLVNPGKWISQPRAEENLWHRLNNKKYGYHGRASNSREENPVESPLRIGSFNIQTLGKKKFNNLAVMITVERVVLRYDLIAILEVMVSENFYIHKFLKEINRLAPKGVVYDVSISHMPDHPNAPTSEQVVFFYRTDKLKVLHSEMYPNPELKFYRSPYIVTFSSPTLRDMSRFIAVGLHVKPSQAVQEIDALADVYDYIHDKLKMEDVLMMGDFNADCTYVGETKWDEIALWTRQEFTWPIGHHIDTTTNHKSCALDRFVFAGSKMENGVIMESAQVFNFQEAYGLSTSEIRAISDHWPIEIQIRGKMSDEAEKHLSSEVCVKVKDSRQVSVSAESIITKSKAVGYISKKYPNGFSLRNVTTSEDEVGASLLALKAAFPILLSHEQLQGIIYKVQHESLLDPSSYADVNATKFIITVRVDDAQSTVFICRKTTVN